MNYILDGLLSCIQGKELRAMSRHHHTVFIFVELSILRIFRGNFVHVSRTEPRFCICVRGSGRAQNPSTKANRDRGSIRGKNHEICDNIWQL